MSIVGVEQTEETKGAFLLRGGKLLRIEGNEDTITEVVKATVAIGDAFKNLDGVVASLGEAI